MTTVVDDEEHFNGFVYCFRAQVLRIVRAGVQVFTCDACFIKSELNGLHGWALCNLCSRDSNANLVCLASCLCPKENSAGYSIMFEKVMLVDLTEKDHPTARTFGEYLNRAESLMLSDRHKGEGIYRLFSQHAHIE